ncbi:MAG: MFS transporter [Kiritimatiellae bacterium]|nr:MFS transporter [Kiritimatiellia bacterium]
MVPQNDHTQGGKRLLVLPASVAIQTCLGGVYAWSAFAVPLRSDFSLTAAQTQFIFGTAIAALTIAMFFGGRWLASFGARRLTVLAGVLFGSGHLVTASSGGDFALILTGSGLLAGIGAGLGYAAVLTTVGEWFPRNRGLVIGVAVAGFGAGAMILSAVVSRLLQGGLPVLDVFRSVGMTYAAVIVLAATLLFSAAPAPATTAEGLEGPNPRLDRECCTLIAGMFSGSFAGLLVIGDLASLGMVGGLPLRMATLAIGGFAVGNSAGRVVWGCLADRFGYRTIPFSLIFLAVALVSLYMARSQAGFFLAAAIAAGFGFGANFVLYAARMATRHGARGIAILYPQIFLAYGFAGITGPSMGGYLHDVSGTYGPAIGIAVVLLLAAAKLADTSDPTRCS